MRKLILFTPLLASCVHVAEPQTCEQWSDQKTDFVYALMVETMNRADSLPNPSQLSVEQESELKKAISESANELFNVD